MCECGVDPLLDIQSNASGYVDGSMRVCEFIIGRAPKRERKCRWLCVALSAHSLPPDNDRGSKVKPLKFPNSENENTQDDCIKTLKGEGRE